MSSLLCEYWGESDFVEKTVEKMHKYKGRYYFFVEFQLSSAARAVSVTGQV